MEQAVHDIMTRSVLLIPALNEEASIGDLLDEVHALYPDLDVVVINDGSTDRTAEVAEAHGAIVLSLPVNLGVAGAMQTGFQWAMSRGYRYAIRCDGDGQHPPEMIERIVKRMNETGDDLVVGSRCLDGEKYNNSVLRTVGIRLLAFWLSVICRRKITDPTSGFQMMNHLLIRYFSHYYPSDYPEPESLALLSRQGYQYSEVGVAFRKRSAGVSSLTGFSGLYFAVKVLLALIIDRARSVDPAYAKSALREEAS